MLSEEAKTQIKAEEVFRQEIRQELERERNEQEKKKSIGEGIWAFLNTSLGIWFLATIVIGFGTWAFTNWQNSRAKEANNQQAIKQLDQEIALRLNHFNNTVNGLKGFRAFSSALASLEKPTNSEFSINGYPEYKDRGLSSLLIELQSRVPEDQKAVIANALSGCKELSKTSARYLERRTKIQAADEDDFIDFNDLQPIYSIVNEKLIIARWPANRMQ